MPGRASPDCPARDPGSTSRSRCAVHVPRARTSDVHLRVRPEGGSRPSGDMGKFQSKHGKERAVGGREGGGWAPPLTAPSLFPVSSDRAAAAAACKRRESPEGEPGRGQGARRPRGRMRRAPSLGRALPRALGWDTPWVSGNAWPRVSGYRVGAARKAGQKRTPRGSRSPSFSVGALFPARLRAGRRGQLRGVCVRE